MNNASVAKNTLLLYLRMGVSMIVSLYTSRVVLSALGIEDFGVYGVVGGIVAMFAFLNGALSTSTSRFITAALGENSQSKLKKYFSASLIIHVLLAFVILICAEIIGLYMIYNELVIPQDKLGVVQVVLHFSILSAVCSIVIVPLNSLIIANERMNIYAYLTISDTFIKLGIAYLIQLVQTGRLEFYAMLLFISSLLNVIFIALYCWKSFSYVKLELVKEKNIYIELTSFTTWSLLGNLAWVGYTQGLNMLLNIFFGPVVNAARAISLQVESAIRTFTTNFQTAINPRILKSYAAHELAYMHKMVFVSARYSCYLLLMLALPVVLETETILTLWLKNVPAHTASFVRVMLLVATMETMSNSIMTSVVSTGKIKKYHMYVGGLLLAIVPVSYVVLKLGGSPLSAFIVYAVIEFLACVIRLALISPMIGLSKRIYLKTVVLNCLMVVAISSIMPLLIHYLISQELIRLFVVCVVSGFSSILTIYIVGLSTDEKLYVTSIIKSKLHIS